MQKLVVITGASSGIGKEIAKLYLKKNYRLVLCGRKKEGLEQFKKNPNIDLMIGDLTDDKTVTEIVALCKTKHKRIDILVNNAGIANIQPFETVTSEQIDTILATNLSAHIKLTRQIYPLMQKQQFGHIVFVNSSAGKEPKLHHALYCAAKFGLSGFAQSLRLEAKKHNIRVTSFHPGGVRTNLYSTLANPPDNSQFMDPIKVAEVLVYLTETEGISPDEILINRMSK